MATRIQIRRDNAAVWALVNPVLGDGEIGPTVRRHSIHDCV